MNAKSKKRKRHRQTLFSVAAHSFALLNRTERWETVFLLVLMILTGIVEMMVVTSIIPLIAILLNPQHLAKIPVIGKYLEAVGSGRGFVYMMAGLLGLLILSLVLTFTTQALIEVYGSRSKIRLTHELLNQIVSAPMIWLLTRNTTELSRQLFFDLNIWRSEMIQPVLVLTQGVLMTVLPVAAITIAAPSAGIGVLVIAGLTAGATLLLARRRIVALAAVFKNAQVRSVKLLNEILGGVRDIKMLGNTTYFSDLFIGELKTVHEAMAKSRNWSSAAPMLVMFVGQAGFIIMAMVLWAEGRPGSEIASVLGTLAVIVARIIPIINRVVGQVGGLYRGVPHVTGLFDLMDELRLINQARPAGGTLPVPENWQSVKLEAISFRFPSSERDVLDRVSLEIRRGGFYGIVGRSGSGKSTLLNILVGLIAPSEGRVAVDGIELKDYRIDDWVRRIGLVAQDPFILDASVGDNIQFGMTDGPDDDRLQRAIDLAVLGELGNDGNDATVPVSEIAVGERGKRVSGGQAQRIAIARTLYRGGDFVVLDEATSALDTITERQISENVRRNGPGQTVLMVTHRLTPLKGCDRIFVMDDGRLVAHGSWDELLANSSAFRALVEATEHSEAA
jgi:ATP-binding cassette, subfamily B, bacterial PglK